MDRREALGFLAAAGAAAALPRVVGAQPAALARPIPATGEALPVIGLGTWITFDVTDAGERRARGETSCALSSRAGGRLVDSLAHVRRFRGDDRRSLPQDAPRLFAATKVWTSGGMLADAARSRTRAPSGA